MVIRPVADADSIVSDQYDDAAWFGGQFSNHSELFGQVRPGTLQVAIDKEVVRDVHVAPEEAGHAAARVDGADGGGPTLSLRVDTD